MEYVPPIATASAKSGGRPDNISLTSATPVKLPAFGTIWPTAAYRAPPAFAWSMKTEFPIDAFEKLPPLPWLKAEPTAVGPGLMSVAVGAVTTRRIAWGPIAKYERGLPISVLSVVIVPRPQ